jgi:putative spermidine/putrescine transport system substrate-binding protein
MRSAPSRLRRALGAALLGLLGAALAAAAPAPAARAQNLVVTAYGGIWEAAVRECYVAEYTRRTGRPVDVVLGGPPQWMNQIAASPARPPIDVIMNTPDGAHEAIRRGLVDPMDASKVPALSEIAPPLVAAGNGHGTVINYGSMGVAYNTRTVRNPPRTWQEFVDGTVRGTWRASIPGIGYVFTPTTVIWAFAHAFGGGVDNVDPAFAALRRMRDSRNLIFWNDVNEALTQLRTGEADVIMYWDGRTWAFVDEGNPNIGYLNPKPGGAMNPIVVQKVKNGSEAAWEFINTALSAGPQSCFSNRLQYPVANTRVEYDARMRERISRLEDTIQPPFDQLPSRVGGWIERWNREIARR